MLAKSKTDFDVLVVGSGASGGWACKRLSEAGLKVALLEAGRPQTDANFSEHKPAFKLKYRNLAPDIVRKTRPIQSKFDVCSEYTTTGSSTISRNRTPLQKTNRLTGWAASA